jgi:hypothetical protein
MKYKPIKNIAVRMIGRKTCRNAARNIEGSAPDNGRVRVSTTIAG